MTTTSDANNEKIYWSIGVSKNMLVLELPEGTDGEEFVASLNDDEMFLIADWFGQELKNSIGEDMYEERGNMGTQYS